MQPPQGLVQKVKGLAKLKSIAEAAQVRETQYPTHVPLGQWYGAFALRKNVNGVGT